MKTLKSGKNRPTCAGIEDGESGAAQEVSPRSEPVCPMCCKPVFTDGYEGDTRELKAALSWALSKIPRPTLVLGQNDEHCKKYFEAERLLGEPA